MLLHLNCNLYIKITNYVLSCLQFRDLTNGGFYWTVAGTVSSLRVEIDTQGEAVERHNVIMECRFDLEAATFKSVRWSKNGKEFLSMVQSREPFLEAYPVPGINLDVSKNYTFDWVGDRLFNYIIFLKHGLVGININKFTIYITSVYNFTAENVGWKKQV